MLSTVYRYIARLAACAAAALFILAAPAQVSAQSNPTVDQFLANPSQFLQQYPNGGPQLISLIRDAAVSNPAALQTIVSLLSSANAAQQAAIGSGLGQAAQIVVRTNPAYANQIQQAVASSGNENANTAFAGVTGNVTTAATGGGGGGGAGGGGGSGGPAGGSGGGFGGAPGGGANGGGGGGTGGGQNFATNSQQFTGGGAGGPGGASNSVSAR